MHIALTTRVWNLRRAPVSAVQLLALVVLVPIAAVLDALIDDSRLRPEDQ